MINNDNCSSNGLDCYNLARIASICSSLIITCAIKSFKTSLQKQKHYKNDVLVNYGNLFKWNEFGNNICFY